MKNNLSKIYLMTFFLIALNLTSSNIVVSETNSHVFFKSPKNGDTVTSPVTVEMGVEGMTVSPAGEIKKDQGHHHLIIDGSPIKEGEIVIADETHIHFGKGQTETSIPLAAGKHKLTLQFADGTHHSYGEKLSSTIEVTVK